jgi:hypothetical protein
MNSFKINSAEYTVKLSEMEIRLVFDESGLLIETIEEGKNKYVQLPREILTDLMRVLSEKT